MADTKRELLEMAAKAVGKDIDPDRYDEDDGFAIRDMAHWWNPIDNDAHAMRLACTLEIDVIFRVVTTVRVEALAPGGPRITAPYKGASKRAAAARLAITRVAAEKGKAMP